MPRFKVDLVSIDPADEKKDIEFSVFVNASNGNEAIKKAKHIQKSEHPDIHPAKTWAWSFYETAEK